MIDLKFKEYDRGNVRAYFKHGRELYCLQPNYTIELLVCSRDGEPSHQVDDGINYMFTGFDGARWSMIDMLEYFSDCQGGGDLMRRMNELFDDVEAA